MDQNKSVALMYGAAKYFNSTKARSNVERAALSPTGEARTRDRWQRVGAVVNRAGLDDTSSDSDLVAENDEDAAMSRKRTREQKQEREKYAKVSQIDG